MDRLQYVAPERQTVAFRQPPNLNFSQAANRRKSLNAVMLKSALDLPQQHRPGWNGQRFQITNVDIVVEPGWTVVPLSVIKELKVSGLKILFFENFDLKKSTPNSFFRKL